MTDILRLTANPLTTIPTGELIPWLRNELNKGEIDLVIIGKPTQMNGQESESMNYIRPFMQTFRQTWPAMPLVEYDERFTSTLAHRAMIDVGMKRSQRRDKAVVDKIAACIILEGYLDSLGN